MTAQVTEYIPGPLEKPEVKITSDKFTGYFTVRRTNDGYIFYEIVSSNGKLAAHLQGKYARMKDAVQAVLKHEERSKKSAHKATKDRYDAKDAAKNTGNTD